ncbi:MAG: lipopolysaccharide biosynthesis protein [Mucilaginibacter sp.]|nr:lipopolysaccharide biosynthesis protein [Mucilaginibacter sp.]
MDINKEYYPQTLTAKDLFKKVQQYRRHLVSRWKFILLFSIIGIVAGVAYASLKKNNYLAICSFVVDDNDKSSLGQFSGLASMVGLDIGSGSSSSNGIFQGDNLIELYKSRLMIKKTLLSKGTFNAKNELLINRYIDFNDLKNKWHNIAGISNIDFNRYDPNFTRLQDSVIKEITKEIQLKNLTVYKKDKKLNIINVSYSSKDENFARQFTNSIVTNVNQFYIKTKTAKSYNNVILLQQQADSVRNLLNLSIRGSASAVDQNPNSNPALQVLKVPSLKKQVDVAANQAIYVEIMKNLELARLSLKKETPLIQVIDEPTLPLDSDKISITKGAIAGCMIAVLLSLLILTYNLIKIKLTAE